MERKPISVKLALGNTAARGRIDSGSPPTSGCAVIQELDLVGSSEMDSCRGTGMPRHRRA